MTIDEQIATHGFSTNTLADTLDHYNREIRGRSDADASASLDPIFIPGQITPVQTEGADIGVNYNMAHSSTSGLAVVVQPYLNMSESDWVEVFWGDDDVRPVAIPGKSTRNCAMFGPSIPTIVASRHSGPMAGW